MENALFYPFYMLKTREQADRLVLKPRPNAKPWDASMHHLRAVIAERGVRQGLFRGFWASNILSFPAYAAYMVSACECARSASAHACVPLRV